MLLIRVYSKPISCTTHLFTEQEENHQYKNLFLILETTKHSNLSGIIVNYAPTFSGYQSKQSSETLMNMLMVSSNESIMDTALILMPCCAGSEVP